MERERPYHEEESPDTRRRPDAESGHPLTAAQRVDVRQLVDLYFAAHPQVSREYVGEVRLKAIEALSRKWEMLDGSREREKARKAGVMDRLRKSAVGRWGPLMVTAAGMGAAGAEAARRGLEDVQTEPAATVIEPVAPPAAPELLPRRQESVIDLEAMDAQATPERMRRLMGTLPGGWVGADVGSIRYVDALGPQVSNMKAGSFATATAEELPTTGKTDIVFYADAKKYSRTQVFGGTLLHEVAHANDWVNDGAMPPDLRTQLGTASLSRLAAPDRYKSAYVESIDGKATAQRAREYFAEIAEAYLNAHVVSEVLQPADVAIVEAAIQYSDPLFDRRQALDSRIELIREMRWDGSRPAVESAILSSGGSADNVRELDAWMRPRLRPSAADDAGQREKRRRLTAKVADWVASSGENPGRILYADGLLAVLRAREAFFDALAVSDDPKTFSRYSEEYAAALRTLRQDDAEPADNGQHRFRDEVLRLVDESDIVLGQSARGGWLAPGEKQELDGLAYAIAPEVPGVVEMLGWSQYDADAIEVTVTVTAPRGKSKKHKRK